MLVFQYWRSIGWCEASQLNGHTLHRLPAKSDRGRNLSVCSFVQGRRWYLEKFLLIRLRAPVHELRTILQEVSWDIEEF